MGFAALLAGIFFLVAYAFIVSEKVHKTIVVMLGTLSLFAAQIYLGHGYDNQFTHALEFVDFNVISLIIGMMIIVQLTSNSGVFTHIAMKIVNLSRGNMKLIFFLLMVLTAGLTAFLSNVTTVMIMTPILLAICLRFRLPPLPFLMSEIILSNIGGTATPLGDMTNIIIASRAGFSFGTVVSNLGPVVFIIILLVAGIATFLNRKSLLSPHIDELNSLRGENFIRDRKLMWQGLSVLVAVVLGLIFKEPLHLENGITALGGAMIFLLITRVSPEKAFKEYVNWSIIFFFVGLFIMIGALEITGIVEWIANHIFALTGNNQTILGMIILWVSAVFSAFVDNIPFATAMIPVIKNIGIMSSTNVDPLYWSLALGACIGGAGTLVGASCNLVVAGIAEQNGLKITFLQYLKYAFPLMLGSIAVSTLYLFFWVL